jgi:hypothetical protein
VQGAARQHRDRELQLRDRALKPDHPADGQRPPQGDDARKALTFLLVKAAIFIGVPIMAAVVAVMLTLK